MSQQEGRHRSFFHIQKGEGLEERSFSQVAKDDAAAQDLIDFISQDEVGAGSSVSTVFGKRPLVYADFVASGRALGHIERYLMDEVLPRYANTHTTTSVTGLHTTVLRHEARDILKRAVHASDEHALIFAGSGATAAASALVHCMGVADAVAAPRAAHGPPVVLIGPFNHHSNILPWRETGAECLRIPLAASGLVDMAALEATLVALAARPAPPSLVIGAFAAASNLTGVLTDTRAVSALLHAHNAVGVWDCAAAAPHLPLDMGVMDAAFWSMHKFVGGVGAPGVLVVHRRLLVGQRPHQPGGGTVFFVRRDGVRYLRDEEEREEGGTPDIVGAIRAGLAMQLHQAVGVSRIVAREHALATRVGAALASTPNLVWIGPHTDTTPRLPTFAFLIRFNDTLFLHWSFVCALLNDLFGIQTRGGCVCAGPYAQDLLGIDEQLAREYEDVLAESDALDRHLLKRNYEGSLEVLRPGVVRMSLAYHTSDAHVAYVVAAIALVAQHGWRLLPDYKFDLETGEWTHRRHNRLVGRAWISAISYSEGRPVHKPVDDDPHADAPLPDLDTVLADAEQRMLGARPPSAMPAVVRFGEAGDELRWFALPSEAVARLREVPLRVVGDVHVPAEPPFVVVDYPHAAGSEGEAAGAEGAEGEEGEDEGEEGEPVIRFHNPPKKPFKAMCQAIEEYDMIRDGDRVLVAVSGGKDSMSLVHFLHQYQQYARHALGVSFELGAITVDPLTAAFDPRPLIAYFETLGVPYFYHSEGILDRARELGNVKSICSFCSRSKRGALVSTARQEGYNVIALGQHLDDLAESFLMFLMHNGVLRTMSAQFALKEDALRIVRPFVHVRERDLRAFAYGVKLPVIAENCPGCFEAPKERHRVKQLLAAQEVLFPEILDKIRAAIHPLLATGAIPTTTTTTTAATAATATGQGGDDFGIDGC